MTLFNPDMPDIDKKLQKIEDEEIMGVLREQGYSGNEVEFVVRRTHLLESIRKLEDILCEPKEILDILSKEGWSIEEIEDAMKVIRISEMPDDLDIESLPDDVEIILDEDFPELDDEFWEEEDG